MKLVLTLSIILFSQFVLAQSTGGNVELQPTIKKLEPAADKELHAGAANSDYEYAIVSIIDQIKQGRLNAASKLVDDHIETFPKSQIGHLLRADILNAMSTPITGIGGSPQGGQINPQVSDELSGLRQQIINRWRHTKLSSQQAHTHYPASLVDMGKHPYVMVADLSEGRLYLYRNEEGKPELLRDYYMSVGSAGYGKQIEGDNKTPVGVYVVNRYIEGKALPDLYGKGAFPVNYPNRYDRFKKRTGYGIWLHGTPSDTYARSPWSSEGCFVLSNDDLLDIGQYVSADDRTPVILSDKIRWLTSDQIASARQKYLAVIDAWKSDWESLDIESYLQHYAAQDFSLDSQGNAAWMQRKKKVNLTKSFVQVDVQLESLFLYPGEQDMFVVKFTQRYLSNNYSAISSKEQYWKRSPDGRWRIIYDG